MIDSSIFKYFFNKIEGRGFKLYVLRLKEINKLLILVVFIVWKFGNFDLQQGELGSGLIIELDLVDKVKCILDIFL